MSMNRKAFLSELLPSAAVLGAVPLAAAAGVFSSARRASADTPSALASGLSPAPAQKKGPRANYFPNYLLRTHEGKTVRFYDDLIAGKTVLINMMYTVCTGKCPGTTENLVKVQQMLGERVGRDIHMYSISLDPEQDSPAMLKNYVEAYGVQPGWTYLTGDKDDIETLRLKLGFRDPDPKLDKDRSNHAGVVVYGNEAIDRWAACPGLAKPKDIINLIDWMNQTKAPNYQGMNRPRKIGA